MKVIFCLHHFLPDYMAGTELYTLRLAQHLQAAGVQMVILIPGFDRPSTDEYYYEQVRVIRYAENSIEDRAMIMGKKEPDGIAEFVHLLHREKPDIIHFHELAPGRGINISHVEKVHSLGIPIITSFHLSYYTCIKNSLYYKNMEKCDGVIRERVCTDCVYDEKKIKGLKAKLLLNTAMSLFNLDIDASSSINNTMGTALGFPFVINHLRKNLLRLSEMSEKIVVIAKWYDEILRKNGVPASKLVYIRQGLTAAYQQPAFQYQSGPLSVIYIGRITESKGLHLLIDAICLLPEDKIVLHIYGKENDLEYVNRCKLQSGAHKNIIWHGLVAPKEVIATMAKYDLLCLPSVFSEMSPLVIQEAFAAGIPVLASTVYGNVEQINDGVDGWLFRFNDSAHLYYKLLYLVNNLEAVEKAKSSVPFSNPFSEVAKSHLELYTTVLENKNKTEGIYNS